MLESSKQKGLCRQVIAGCSASLGALSAAAIFGWLSPSLPILLGPDSEIPMTEEEASWMSSMPQIGIFFSPIPAGVLANRFGRKTLILTTGPLFLFGWIIVLQFKTLLALNIARLIQGTGIGIIYTVMPMYLGEIANAKFRGMVVSMYYTFFWFGYLFEYIIGSTLSFINFTYLTALTSVVFIAAFIWQPESPYYYLMKNDILRARQSLSWLMNSSDESISDELARMKLSIEQEKLNKVGFKDLIFNPTNRKCLIILVLVGFVSMLCGLVSLSAYSTETLTKEGDYFFLSPETVTILMGIMMFIGTFCCFFVLDVFGRTVSFFVSCFLSGLCMFFVGSFYLLKTHSSLDMTYFTWVPPVGFIIFSATAVIGIFPVSVVYQSELFDTSTRATASSVMALFNTVFGMISFKFYLLTEDAFGVYVNFYLFACVCFFGAVLSVTVLPETKGKSFEEIRELLRK